MNRDTWIGIAIGFFIAAFITAVDNNRQWYEMKQDNAVLESENRQLYERLAK
ncbi:hypothetical protein [Planktothrix sp.]|uniref:hypothetical protein n=1 Tax=Planktothrix sp. TaxID=3088171 RepID=UPI0038D40EBA